ncbi:hypothetical protein PHAVU_003G103501 [Phaseolus vulgaris]|uniref:pleiotropic drug resistance protein 1-like isoform X2 n=2 Tax=Phaseolus vulgaris TaxID=3885 RepID=UPI0035CC1D2B
MCLRMALLQGPPGSGKTTLLLALAGRLGKDLKMAPALFRLMAAIGRDIVVANTAGTFALLAVTVLGGFVISREDVHKWFMWGYWSSPMMYGQNAIVVNEFLGHSWRKVSPNSKETLEVLILKSRGFFPQAYWYWIGIGALIGYVFLFNFLFSLALQYLSLFRKDQAGLSEENLLERNASMAEEFILLPTRKNSSAGTSKIGRGADIFWSNWKQLFPFDPVGFSYAHEVKAQGVRRIIEGFHWHGKDEEA